MRVPPRLAYVVHNIGLRVRAGMWASKLAPYSRNTRADIGRVQRTEFTPKLENDTHCKNRWTAAES